jgi:hypothetical protein
VGSIPPPSPVGRFLAVSTVGYGDDVGEGVMPGLPPESVGIEVGMLVGRFPLKEWWTAPD